MRSSRLPQPDASIIGAAPAATAQPPDQAGPFGQESIPDGLPQLESLDRGLVAVSTSEGVFVSWRLLASEVSGCERDRARPARRSSSRATACPSQRSPTARTWRIPTATRPRRTRSPRSSTASRARSALRSRPAPPATSSVPLTQTRRWRHPQGRGVHLLRQRRECGRRRRRRAYELIVKWDPSNSKDVSQVGYTGEVFLDTYEFDGTLLNRISLGVNIRAGAHYTQFLAYDFDGDGRSELMLKTAPGTKSTTYAADGSVDGRESRDDAGARCRGRRHAPGRLPHERTRTSARTSPSSS